jgi:hypothetical protein
MRSTDFVARLTLASLLLVWAVGALCLNLSVPPSWLVSVWLVVLRFIFAKRVVESFFKSHVGSAREHCTKRWGVWS